MKLLAFVDMHGSLSALKSIREKAKNCDIIICAGDFTIFEQSMQHFIDEFDKLKKQVLIMHGNHEEDEEIKMMCKRHKNLIPLHSSSFIKDDVLFLGWGGGGFSLREPDFEKTAKDFKKLIQQHKDKAVVFVTHAPPYGTKLDKLGKEHAGNKSFTEFLEKNKIDLMICGHLHENEGNIDKVGLTTVINPGPKGREIKL